MTSKTSPTPGPWKLIKHDTKDGHVLTQAETTQHLMYVKEAPGMGDQGTPNFKLLEAAPRLLQEAEKLLAVIDSWGGTIHERHLTGLRAAIKQVTPTAPSSEQDGNVSIEDSPRS